MSFAAPLWLASLLVIPLLGLAQWRWRQRARRYAVRFTAVGSLVQAAAERGGRWRRALSLAAAALAVLALGLALARPRINQRVAIGNAAIVLVLDHSGSMAADDVSPTRIQAAISAADSFIGELPHGVRLGAVAFGTTPTAVQAPVADHAAARQLLGAQQPGGGTATGPALELALQLLDGSRRGHAPAAIVLLSDGAANEGVSPVSVARVAKREGIAIDTVALGTPDGVLYVGPAQTPYPVPPDPQLMAQIARTSGGRSFNAETADELSSIYRSLGSKLGSVERRRDITVEVLGAAAVLLLLALVGSVGRVARLP